MTLLPRTYATRVRISLFNELEYLLFYSCSSHILEFGDLVTVFKFCVLLFDSVSVFSEYVFLYNDGSFFEEKVILCFAKEPLARHYD